jgi:menaquinone-dependent protoporphyrinogen oxidase
VSSQDLWAQRPVWLSTRGPLGADATHAEGADRHADFEPKEIRGFREAIHPRDHRVFVGASIPAGSVSPNGRV